MTIFEGEGQMAARRNGNLFDVLCEGSFIELGKPQNLRTDRFQSVLMDAVVVAGVRGGAGVDVILLAGRALPHLPAVVVSTFRAFDSAGKRSGVPAARSILSFAGDLLAVFFGPAILVACVRAELPDDGSILHEEVKNVALWHFDMIHLVKEDLLVEFGKAEDLSAGFDQTLLTDAALVRAFRKSSSFTGFCFLCAANPVFLFITILRTPIVHVADSAVRTFYLAGKAADVQAFVSKRTELLAPRHFCLHIVEGLLVDDGFVGVLYIVLRKFSVILPALFADRVLDEFLLKKEVSGVSHVREDLLDVGINPPAAFAGRDSLSSKFPLGLEPRFAVEEVLEDPLHDGSFLRDNDQIVTFPSVAVDPEVPIRDALLHALSDSPFHVVADALGF